MVCICRLVHVYIYLYIRISIYSYMFLYIYTVYVVGKHGPSWSIHHLQVGGHHHIITRHHHLFYPQQTPAMILAGLPWTWSAGLMPLELLRFSEGEWDSKPRNVKHTPKVLISYIGVELHLKGGVARSNHTRRDTMYMQSNVILSSKSYLFFQLFVTMAFGCMA